MSERGKRGHCKLIKNLGTDRDEERDSLASSDRLAREDWIHVGSMRFHDRVWIPLVGSGYRCSVSKIISTHQ